MSQLPEGDGYWANVRVFGLRATLALSFGGRE